MIVQIKRIILLSWIFWISVQAVFSQSQVSRDNYTGAWETPASWNPTWTVPQTTYIEGMDIIINGYITVNGSLSFSGSPTNLIINDTLVIKGDLLLDNYNNLTVNGNGILIVRGNFNFNNHAIIITNNYIVITGDINVGGPDHGSFTGNDNPVEVFIGGTISPIGVTTNNSNYPALNCTASITTRYPHSNCSYGDITDIINDPIYSFFQSTCITATFTGSDADNSFCAGTSVTFTAGGGANYNFRVNGTSVQNSGSMTYTTTTLSNGQIVDVIVTNAGGCTVTSAGITNTVLALPTPTLAGPTPVCVGVAGKVYTTEAGMSNYIWTVSAGGTITAGGGTGNNTVTVTWTTTGAKTVTVNYTNANGCTATSPTTYNLTINALPVATASNNGPVCVGNTINLTSSDGTGYSWGGPNGFTSSAQNPSIPNAITAMAGAYKVTVTATTGCTATNTTSVIVNALPIAIAGSNSPVCAGNTINLTSSGGTGYSWSGPNAFTSILQNPSISPADTTMSGAYKVTVTAATGCTATKTTNVIVNALPIATAGSNSPVCEGNTINLTSSGGTGYSWSGPNGFTSSAQNPSIPIANPAMSGAYKVTVTAATGCTNTNTTSIIVNALPTASITITDNSEIANNDGIICNGTTATLSAFGGTSYMWSSGETTAAITKGTAGTYTVTVTNVNGCTDTATATVVVNASPVAKASNNGPVFSFKALNLTGGPEGMTTYSWTGPGGFTSNSQSPSVSANAIAAMAGVYTLTVTNASGCTNTATTPVEVNALPVPSVITPNGDGKNDYFNIGEIIGQVELIIFNRWGNEEYTNCNYLNDWDGRNNKGVELPNDTYFYILKFENVKIKKGSVLIKR